MTTPSPRPKMIRVSYSCPVCHITDRYIHVPKRERATEAISAWLDATIVLISEDHATQSPSCTVAQLHDLRIVPEGIAWIGTFPVQTEQQVSDRETRRSPDSDRERGQSPESDRATGRRTD